MGPHIGLIPDVGGQTISSPEGEQRRHRAHTASHRFRCTRGRRRSGGGRSGGGPAGGDSHWTLGSGSWGLQDVQVVISCLSTMSLAWFWFCVYKNATLYVLIYIYTIIYMLYSSC